ncbi:hypothetical protein BOH74_20980 [Pseudomonas versuta]|uniref:Uncharacterized protein n=1 Tax=Pseudomonas versuta TaxID=1788301 RepID=A0A0M4R335_9PSED|nr:hypothetical protein AOC04_05425 [Pseudomonas versuta]OKA18180.1 hypothetical protein BOH74_20980 [Pseudomonas versuta]OKA20411.1 hypothetical protein BOH73_15450 [Pseudomonas versuta]
MLPCKPDFQKALFFQASNDLRYVHAIHTGKACDLMLSDLLTVVAYEGEQLSREIWMAVHRDLRPSPQVRAVMDFLLKIVTQNAAFTLNG